MSEFESEVDGTPPDHVDIVTCPNDPLSPVICQIDECEGDKFDSFVVCVSFGSSVKRRVCNDAVRHFARNLIWRDIGKALEEHYAKVTVIQHQDASHSYSIFCEDELPLPMDEAASEMVVAPLVLPKQPIRDTLQCNSQKDVAAMLGIQFNDYVEYCKQWSSNGACTHTTCIACYSPQNCHPVPMCAECFACVQEEFQDEVDACDESDEESSCAKYQKKYRK